MALDPEPIRLALVARLTEKLTQIAKWYEYDPGIEEVERHLTSSDAVAILQQETLRATGDAGLPSFWDITYQLAIVTKHTRDETAPDSRLNARFVEAQEALLIQEGETSLLQDGDEIYTTLGGLAVRVRIVGDVEFLPGLKAEQMGVTIPIVVTTFDGHSA